MKVLCTGANGMLGTEIKRVFEQHNRSILCTDKDTLDVTHKGQIYDYIRWLPFIPNYILHLAAETDLEYCQNHKKEAHLTNEIGTMYMVDVAKSLKIPMVYISTAGIFDGKKDQYREDSEPNPVNVYGLTKLMGERFVEAYEAHYIFRMSWAIGGGKGVDKKFVSKIINLINGGAKTIYGITDIYGSPTYTRDVAKTIYNSLQFKIPYGTYHTSGNGTASRYDVAKEIVDILHLPAKVVPVTASEFNHINESFPCPRAHNETLISTKHFPTSHMRDWRISLEEYLLEYYA